MVAVTEGARQRMADGKWLSPVQDGEFARAARILRDSSMKNRKSGSKEGKGGDSPSEHPEG
jgi:hypothetical protein